MLRKLMRFGLAGAVSVAIGTAAPMVRAGNPVTGAADKAAEQSESGSADEKAKSAGEATDEKAKSAGEATDDAAKKAGSATEDAAKQGSDASKDAAKKASDKANDLYDPTVRPAE